MRAFPGSKSRALRVFVLTLFFLALLIVLDPRGLARDDSTPAFRGIRELAVFETEPPIIPVMGTSQDFDGDGVMDVVFRELDVGETKWGSSQVDSILYVDSGRTGERLLWMPTEGFGSAHWYGDYDANGTMDVLFEVDGVWRVFGFVSE